MTEGEARAWLAANFAPDRCAQLDKYVALVLAETRQQNLIAKASAASVWSRHIVDSAQLVALARPGDLRWIDVGSGAGLPGIVVAILTDAQVDLIEPRAKRAAFLADCVTTLSLGGRVTIHARKAERCEAPVADVISARAVSGVDQLLTMTYHLRNAATRLILPRGRSAQDDLAEVQSRWRGVFHVEQSVTDPEAGILLIDAVQRR